MVKINSDGIFENPIKNSPPSVDKDAPVGSVTDIRGVRVQNTVDAPAHGNGGSGGLTTGIPSKLPFD
jgi:hypothetical protein